ncbi:MAG: HIT family protein [Chloroflexota bacterium]
MPSTNEHVATARLGTNPTIICRVPSGWVGMCGMQYLRGYCILMPDPVVASINALTRTQRAEYLCDMALIGDALLEVTGAYRINYAIMGNSDQVLHAHIVPRYADEPAVYRKGGPWSYPQEVQDTVLFDLERDRALMGQLAAAIQQRLV